MDCMDAMRQMDENEFELAICDPPYGIRMNANMGIKKGQRKRHDRRVDWDNNIPDVEYFELLKRVSVNQIIWGGNYFPLGPSRHVIWWEKETPDGMSFSSGELAWTSFERANKSYRKHNVTGDKIHPTQKPVSLYKWLLVNYAFPGDRILDTHLGSGTSRIAAHELGFDFTGFEIDTAHFRNHERYFIQHVRQLKAFQPNEMYAKPNDERIDPLLFDL